MKVRAVDLFAGGGGFSEGLTDAGVEVVAAVDFDRWCAVTYARNHPGTPFLLEEIQAVTKGTLKPYLGDRHLDLVVGGSPCEGFSIIGRREEDDPRNGLIHEYCRLVLDLRPRAFVLENVFGLMSLGGGVYRKAVEDALAADYRLAETRVIDASKFGVPQRRRRVFFAGVRRDLGVEPPDFSSLREVVAPSVQDAIGDLPEGVIEVKRVIQERDTSDYRGEPVSDFQREMRSGGGVRGWNGELYNQHTKGHTPTRLRRMQGVEPGGRGNGFSGALRAGGFPHKYRRLHPDRPSPAVTAHVAKDLSDFIHYEHDRWITVREAARLQTFPDDYTWVGISEFQALRQIGRAVPPKLAAVLVRHVLQCLDHRDMGNGTRRPTQCKKVPAKAVSVVRRERKAISVAAPRGAVPGPDSGGPSKTNQRSRRRSLPPDVLR